MKTYEIEFTTDQSNTPNGWTDNDLREFWERMWTQTNFGRSYIQEVISDRGLVKHTILTMIESDPTQDSGEILDEIDGWIREVNGIAPHQFIELDELLSIKEVLEVA